MSKDTIYRQAAIEALDAIASELHERKRLDEEYIASWCAEVIEDLPSAEPEQTDCDYCHENRDGFVKPIEKNCHAAIHGSVLYLKAKGWHGEAQIKYCPMCGRRLER